MLDGHGVYKERLERTVKLPAFSSAIVERVFQYCFEDFILNQCNTLALSFNLFSSILHKSPKVFDLYRWWRRGKRKLWRYFRFEKDIRGSTSWHLTKQLFTQKVVFPITKVVTLFTKLLIPQFVARKQWILIHQPLFVPEAIILWARVQSVPFIPCES